MFSARKLWIYSIVIKEPAKTTASPVAGTIFGPTGAVIQAQIRKIENTTSPTMPRTIAYSARRAILTATVRIMKSIAVMGPTQGDL